MTATSMPSAFTSTAREVAKWETAALVAPYKQEKGEGKMLAGEEVKVMAPRRPAAFMRRRNRCVSAMAEVSLHAMLASCFAHSPSSKKPVTM